MALIFATECFMIPLATTDILSHGRIRILQDALAQATIRIFLLTAQPMARAIIPSQRMLWRKRSAQRQQQ